MSRRSVLERSLVVGLAGTMFGGLELMADVAAAQQPAGPQSSGANRPTIRRVVTGNNAQGKSYIVSDERVPASGLPSLFKTTPEMPLGDGRPGDPPKILASDFKAIDIPMGGSWFQFTARPAATPDFKPLPHRSDTIDYHIQISGELTLILDEGETTLMPGDVAIQRNTSHAWRAKTPVTFVVVLLPLPK